MYPERPIRVCHVICSTGAYGAERWILAQMGYLDSQKVHATVVNLVDRNGDRSAIVAEAQKRGYAALDFYTGGRFNPVAACRLAGLLRKHRFDILHSHGYKSDILGLLTARLTNMRVVSTPHGWSQETDAKLRLYETVGKASFSFMDRVCPLSLGLYETLKRAGVTESRMTMIQNGVDIAEIDEAPKFPKIEGKKRIGFMGKLNASKGVNDLVDAFFLLARPDCELFLIGEGPCRDGVLRRFKAEKKEMMIHCPGFVSNRLEYLKSFDVLVLPSLSEGTPRCIMEAQAARVPVVGSDIDGIRNLVKHEHSGLLIPPKSAALLAKAIGRILDFPEVAEKFADQGRQLLEREFSAARMAREYESLYLSVIEDASSNAH